jgi:hypothetical protein
MGGVGLDALRSSDEDMFNAYTNVNESFWLEVSAIEVKIG